MASICFAFLCISTWFSNSKAFHTPAAYVSPPFVDAVVQIYDSPAIREILSKTSDTIEEYNPEWGKSGIALSFIYGIRNARMALQHYAHKKTLIIEGHDWHWIWSEMYSYETTIFASFNAWNSHRNQNEWFGFTRTILDIFGNDKKLKLYVQHMVQSTAEHSNWDILMPVFYNSNNGNELQNNMKLYKNEHYIVLNNGLEIPLIGFGSWPLTGTKCKESVKMAIVNGYRMIDTSENYNNEQVIGQALNELFAEQIVNRSDIFIADKLSYNQNYGKGKTRNAFMESLRKLNVEYIDVYMTHGAIADKRRLKETWVELEELYAEGKIRALAVSNYGVQDMKDLMKYAKILPVFVQNKYDIFTSGQQSPWSEPINTWAIDTFDDYHIFTQGYCILNSWPHVMAAVNDVHVRWIAQKYEGKNPAQILLRWAMQSGILILTRSSQQLRQLENRNIFDFELNEIDMNLLTALITLYSPYDIQWVDDVYDQVGNRPDLQNHRKGEL